MGEWCGEGRDLVKCNCQVLNMSYRKIVETLIYKKVERSVLTGFCLGREEGMLTSVVDLLHLVG